MCKRTFQTPKRITYVCVNIAQLRGPILKVDDISTEVSPHMFELITSASVCRFPLEGHWGEVFFLQKFRSSGELIIYLYKHLTEDVVIPLVRTTGVAIAYVCDSVIDLVLFMDSKLAGAIAIGSSLKEWLLMKL